MHRFTPTRLAIGGVVLLCFGWAGVAQAQRRELDNFDFSPGGGFNNSFFNHVLGSHEFGADGPPDETFTDADSVSRPFAYFVTGGTDFISFKLAEGEFVNHAEIWMLSTLPTTGFASTFHVIGRDASNEALELIVDSPITPDKSEPEWVFFDTSGTAFASIEEIRLSNAGTKGFFDDLAVNVVPEPATCIMLGVGLSGLLWTRRRRTS